MKDKDEAADIVQEVFLYLWDKHESIKFESTILAYLCSAFRYKFFKLLDKKKVGLGSNQGPKDYEVFYLSNKLKKAIDL